MDGLIASAGEFLADEGAVAAATALDRQRRSGMGELRDAFEDVRSGRCGLARLAERLRQPLWEVFAPSSGSPLNLWGLENEDERAFAERLAGAADRRADLELAQVLGAYLEELPHTDPERVQQLLAFGELVASIDARGGEGDPRLGVGPAACFLTFAWHCLSSGKEPVFLYESNRAIKALAAAGLLDAGATARGRDLEARFLTFYEVAHALEHALAGAPKIMRSGWAMEHALAWVWERVEGIPSSSGSETDAARSGMWQPRSRQELRDEIESRDGPSIQPPKSGVHSRPAIERPLSSGSHERPVIEPPRAGHRSDESDVELEPLELSGSDLEPSDESDFELEELEELDEVEELDELDEVEELDELDEVEELDELDEVEELDELDEVEEPDDDPRQAPHTAPDTHDFHVVTPDPEGDRFGRSAKKKKKSTVVYAETRVLETSGVDLADALPPDRSQGNFVPPADKQLRREERERADRNEREKRKTDTRRFSRERAREREREEATQRLAAEEGRVAEEGERRRRESELQAKLDAAARAAAKLAREARKAAKAAGISVQYAPEVEDDPPDEASSDLMRALEGAGPLTELAGPLDPGESEEASSVLSDPLASLIDDPREPLPSGSSTESALGEGSSEEGTLIEDSTSNDAWNRPRGERTRRYQAPALGKIDHDAATQRYRPLEEPTVPVAPRARAIAPLGEVDSEGPTRRYEPSEQPRKSHRSDDGPDLEALVSEFRGEVQQVNRAPRVERRSSDRIARDLYLDPALWTDMQEALEHRGALLLVGPIGAGKTYVARRLAIHLAGHDDRMLVVRSHPDLSYEDLVDGPRGMGIVRAFCERAHEDPQRRYVLLLDELDRGDAAKALGETLGALAERGRRVRLGRSHAPFIAPRNLAVIATARALPHDPALQGRFPTLDMPGDPKVLARFLAHCRPEFEWIADLYAALLKRLQETGQSVRIGHGLFMDPELDLRRVKAIWRREVLPWLRSQGVEPAGLRYEDLRPRGDD
jgi:hypothetical protein